ncbi:hypothetical protein SAMN00120144_1155 [Hymenobacter roseosalivarius DSM 11622]|uniref:Uncharacterized protein n=1 Tax=Hymenobacter roseosalivarius DSM 11622 TaxID=645990 RepID=A0A1W1V450_9BACT|nr:hypothetical protein [Hymenobacter roseosalivarius]SMB88085.1 hypothetical protein SAMN00120144_1155 [Hymenobacter roseosalivarius DSM 11622]
MNSIEAYNGFRSIDFPAALPNSSEPQRLLYPETERTTDSPEVTQPGSLDDLRDGVWWNK